MKEREREQKEGRKNKKRGAEDKSGGAKRKKNHMLNEYACRFHARLEIQLRVQTNIHDRYGKECEMSYLCEYFTI